MSARAASAPVALTIAGSDSSGGAGIQADLKTFCAFGVYGASVVTALTAQNTRRVSAIEAVAPQLVAAQLEAVLSDLDVAVVKTGMLANAAIVDVVARRLRAGPPRPLIVDPVMVASSGGALLAADLASARRRRGRAGRLNLQTDLAGLQQGRPVERGRESGQCALGCVRSKPHGHVY